MEEGPKVEEELETGPKEQLLSGIRRKSCVDREVVGGLLCTLEVYMAEGFKMTEWCWTGDPRRSRDATGKTAPRVRARKRVELRKRKCFL